MILFKTARFRESVLIGILVVACAATVQANDTNRYFEFLENTPEVRSAQQRVRVAQMAVGVAKAPMLPDASLSTLGSMWRHDSKKAPLGRGGVGDEHYLDALVSVSVPLYDFGATGLSVSSANSKVGAAQVRVDQVKSRVASQALTTASQYRSYKVQKALFAEYLERLQAFISLEEERYKKGFSTLDKLRSLKLTLLDTESRSFEIASKLERSTLLLDRRFSGFRYEELNIDALIDYLESGLRFSSDMLLALERKAYVEERLALLSKVESLGSSRLPKLELKGSSRFYDVDEGGLDKYSLEAGVQLTVNLFDGGEKRNQIDEIESQRELLDVTFIEKLDAAQDQQDLSRAQLALYKSDLRDLKARAELLSERSSVLEMRRELGGLTIDEEQEFAARSFENRVAREEAKLAIHVTTIELAELSEQLYGLLVNFKQLEK